MPRGQSFDVCLQTNAWLTVDKRMDDRSQTHGRPQSNVTAVVESIENEA